MLEWGRYFECRSKQTSRYGDSFCLVVELKFFYDSNSALGLQCGGDSDATSEQSFVRYSPGYVHVHLNGLGDKISDIIIKHLVTLC